MPRQEIKTDKKILVGTSGYSYAEWVDAGFYPQGTKSAHMLAHYAGVFPVTELNFTWYQMPKAQVLERMRGQVPPGFRFAAKLTRTLTHEVAPDEWRREVEKYREGISPLLQSRQLVAILVQLAPFFDRSPANRQYLAALLDELAGLPLAVEFRHRSWANDRVFDELSRRKVTLVTVDAPDLPGLFPTLDVVTNPDLLYLRLHGRNIQGWRSGNMQKKFDYSYSDEELDGMRETISRMAREFRSGVVFFNNHVRGQAVENAQRLKNKGPFAP
jgi:uncharacterized protein YecE (DUF72 family)